ncbi:GCN5-related N-acetyltransferas-like protein [Calycina marina]|uniref:GCN5-related N-acetyltransferas-like protein n=1 Tax=Calycina marina TaxID=1763456 RepID=A0A9P8CHB0_9HELO|nr:GCN5-related N-acetyltransferas-like protein [Calycina marina]
MAPGVVVRHARQDDVPTILQLIIELAIYEKEESSVLATKESLLATLAFAPSPDIASPSDHQTPSTGDSPSPTRPARALLLFTPSGVPAGLALYFYNYSTWRSLPGIYLEDLYVKESERGHGYGTRLLGELAREVVQMGGGRLDWSVLKWNEPSIKFYESIGASAMHDWVGMRLEGDALEKVAKKAN